LTRNLARETGNSQLEISNKKVSIRCKKSLARHKSYFTL